MDNPRGQRNTRISGIVVAAAGLLLLALNFIVPGGMQFTLPLVFFMLGVGFFLLEGYVTRSHGWGAWLLVPAVLLSVFGLVFLLNVVTGDWNAWAYAWLLLAAGLGLGVFLAARALRLNPRIVLAGMITAAAGLALFALFGAIAGGAFIQVMAPILLALGGLGLYILQPGRARPPQHAPGAAAENTGPAPAPDLIGEARAAPAPAATGEALVEPLTPREKDVLRLLAEGCSNAEIASRLTLAPSTVKTHINNIYGKLGAAGRVQAVNRARELNILENGD